MTSFEPITASDNIKGSFVDYITTTFDLADPVYRAKLREELQKPGYISKGPYLELSGSYKTGRSLTELIQVGEVSPLFRELEPVPEEERELKLERPLYLHQEQALRFANEGHNLVVTTGTGSGKTECFLIPVIQQLLREKERGTLDRAVRAILIYPMNALANDQIKRMQELLKGYPELYFGLYNGNTKHEQPEALRDYRTINGPNANPLPNELISRERMQEEPPHILITNYSMLEYMMLRPKDDKVFSGAKLRFIVLDEAHIYKGTTGMETAMLMRRLRARLKAPEQVRYILTSATLGGKEADGDIVTFAQNLCGVPFLPQHIIRSQEALPPMRGEEDYPNALFPALANRTEAVEQVLERFQIPDPCPEGKDEEKLSALLLQSRIFARLIEHTRAPKAISELRDELEPYFHLSEGELIDLIAVCTQAGQEKSSLIKARYHYFIRTLEGAYVTLGRDKQLFLHRRESVGEGEDRRTVFEAAVCTDCGRLAVVGREEQDHCLVQVARKTEDNPSNCDYFLLKDGMEEELESEGEEDQVREDSFVLCARCGQLGTPADLHFGPICGCKAPDYVPVVQVPRTKSGRTRCPACGFGHFRAFYLGNEAATSVLGTELFDQLPAKKLDLKATIRARQEAKSRQENSYDPFRSFAKKKEAQTVTERSARQFLCFSDSRGEAAFFASYMERSYEEFLRRRGMWQVVEEMKANGETRLSVPAFAARLIRLFDARETFLKWSPDHKLDSDSLHEESKRHAWIAILNEMFNARRGTSLPSMGVLSFSYRGNEEWAERLCETSHMPARDLQALLNLLVMDGVYTGAIRPGDQFHLNPFDRKYIFFNETEQVLVKKKLDSRKKDAFGWAGRTRENGTYYPNTRIQRLTQALNLSPEKADRFLMSYWDNVFAPSGEEYMLDANDFTVQVAGAPGLKFYRCKKCGRITSYCVRGRCAYVKCDGTLYEVDPEEELKNNHYASLYRSRQMAPLQIKEHTAQLAKNQQARYQQAFVNGEINALSCSTTFEMGVDVGSLETVYMRNVPPSPSNYIQRAGRAGRSVHSAAFVLTYVKLSSHDLTFYQDPARIISGQIQAPQFTIQNEKVVNRHIYAVALSKFLAAHEEVYDSNNQSVFLNEGGYELLKEYLAQKPESLKQLLQASIPRNLHQRLGIGDFSWTQGLIGEDGVLEIAVKEFRDEVDSLDKARKQCERQKDFGGADRADRALRQFRCGPEDGQRPKQLIDFLVRNNVLPKYGFPVDTVELQIRSSKDFGKDSLQLARDLQVAIAEYAPGAEVIADGNMYVSRYIRRLPGKDNSSAWEEGFYCECPNPDCGEPNFTKNSAVWRQGQACISCGRKIPGGPRYWRRTLEPRRGFWAEDTKKPVPMRRPERDFKMDDCYVGDVQRQRLQHQCFQVGGQELELESTANDSLVVVGQHFYKVCPWCGYAVDEKKAVLGEHKDFRGFPCRNSGPDADQKAKSYRLSHTFKTDVAKVTFYTPEALEKDTMLSVLYALLEGVSRSLDIERTDIKGCLHQVQWAGCQRPIYSVILYDAVAGGAGHMRRLVTPDGGVFRQVLAEALRVVEQCSCTPSCYQCIRNYYNQKIHDILDRNKAAAFLRNWTGEYRPVAKDPAAPEESLPFQITQSEPWSEYGSWTALGSAYDMEQLKSWDEAGIPGDCLVFPTLLLEGEKLEPCFVWPAARVMVFEDAEELDNSPLPAPGWRCLTLDQAPDSLAEQWKEGAYGGHDSQ